MKLLICKICNVECKSVSKHSFHAHGVICKDYYDLYYKVCDSDGCCKICNQSTTFISLEHGYRKYCSDICSTKDEAKNIKISNTVRSSECQLRTKETCISKYGVDHVSKSESFREKSKQSCINKYGVDHHMKNDKFKTSFKNNTISKYGYENVGMVPHIKEKIKSTFLKKYGNVSHFSNKEIKDKIIKYNRETYGVDFKFQSDEFRINAMYKGRYKFKKFKTSFGDTLNYQTKPELKFIKECQRNNIKVLNGEKIPYWFNDKDREYFCDFKILENDTWRLIEIKQKHKWWFDDLRSGKIKAKSMAAIKYSKENNFLPYKIIFIK